MTTRINISKEDSDVSISDFLRSVNVTPPALASHLKGVPLGRDKSNELERERSAKQNQLSTNEAEWMILPKKYSVQKGHMQSNDGLNISPFNEVGSYRKENCLVSPIFLKKKIVNNGKVLLSQAQVNASGDCELGRKTHQSSFSTECQVVLSRNQHLDKLAANDSANQSICLIQDIPIIENMASARNEISSTPIRSPSSKHGLLRSARKKLELTHCSVLKKSIGHGFLTPLILEKNEKLLTKNTLADLEQARIKLQASTLPDSLPCRSNEFNNIRTYVLRKILDGSGGCMYISGVPGTGKTATVHAVVKSLQRDSLENVIPSFDFVEVNALRLTEPRQSYVRIWQTLTGNKVMMEQAMKNLEKQFVGRPNRTTLILVDEMDYLCNKRQDVIYNLLEWTTKQQSRLVLLTIANTMDLPERTLKGKITSRMGLTRLVFQPYTYQQLQEIVMNRLGSCGSFHPDAVQLVARKVAAISGDARRALDICRRAIDNLNNTCDGTVTVFDIEKIINRIFTGTRVQAVKNCSIICKLILRAVRDEVYRTGVEETTFSSVYNHLDTICSLEGVFLPNPGDVMKLCNALADNGLIVVEKDRSDLKKKLSLNVSPDDIHFAFNC